MRETIAIVTIHLSTPEMASRLFSSANLSIDDIANSPVACQLGGCFARADRRGAGTGGVGGGGAVSNKLLDITCSLLSLRRAWSV